MAGNSSNFFLNFLFLAVCRAFFMNNREKNYYLELHREKMIFIPVSNLKFTKNLYRGMTDLIEIREKSEQIIRERN